MFSRSLIAERHTKKKGIPCSTSQDERSKRNERGIEERHGTHSHSIRNV